MTPAVAAPTFTPLTRETWRAPWSMYEALRRFVVDHEAGTFAPGHVVRRHETLPFLADGG